MANQTIALVEYFIEQYNIDTKKVYGSGFSGGGETMSIVMGKRPDLFTAYQRNNQASQGVNYLIFAVLDGGKE